MLKRKIYNKHFLPLIGLATLTACTGNKQEAHQGSLTQANVSLVSNFNTTDRYDAIKRVTPGRNRILTRAHDYGFNGKDSIGPYRVAELVTDTSYYHDLIVAKHLVVMNNQDTIAVVDNEFDMMTGALKSQTLSTKKRKIFNMLTWDDHNDNITALKQNLVEYDPTSGKPTHERQMDVCFSYSSIYSWTRWSNGMARMLMGENCDILVFSGLMGSAPANLIDKISIMEVEASPTPEHRLLSQKMTEGSPKYEVDINFLVLKEQFFDPHYEHNDFEYTYE